MTKSALMKQHIADTFIELVKANPVKKVSVQKTIRTGKIARNTFYYHFQNRLDLMIYIFDQGCRAYGGTDEDIFPNRLRDIMNYLSAEKELYRKLLVDAEESEELKKHIFQAIRSYIQAEFNAAMGSIAIPDDEAEMLVNFLSYASFYQVMGYLQQKRAEWYVSPRRYQAKFNDLYQAVIRFLIENYY